MLAFILHLRFIDSTTVLKLCFSLVCSLYFVFKFGSLENDLSGCPECYGNELCPFFQNETIQLTLFSLLLRIINPSLTKSVFYGVFNGSEIVIKRIVRRTEKSNLFNGVGFNTDGDNFILCDSVRDVSFLSVEVKEVTEKKPWLDSSSSMEPALLMYFQTQGKWPFPKYYGACGDLIVEEYKGEPLSNFLFSDFLKRIFLAARLLEMAELFTFGHPHLAFYFTDYSLDNLVVDSNGSISLIDLDNVIISNKSAVLENSSLKRNIHKSEILDNHKYAFSPADICNHHLSDHNYFSVCRYLLSHPEDGLLTNIEIENHKEIVQLLDECSQPKLTNDRFSAGRSLKLLLKEITSDFIWL